MPLSHLSAPRVTDLTDVMHAAVCSDEFRGDNRALGLVPLIDHNPRSSVKRELAPHKARHYQPRTMYERMNARRKDAFGGKNTRLRGPIKVTSQLMYDVQALNADQRRRLLQGPGSGVLPQQVGAQCRSTATRQ